VQPPTARANFFFQITAREVRARVARKSAGYSRYGEEEEKSHCGVKREMSEWSPRRFSKVFCTRQLFGGCNARKISTE